MANNTPVSTPLKALLEQLGAALAGTAPAPTTAAIYAQLIRIRDESELLEVRASARDAKVSQLLGELATTAMRLEALDAQTSGPSAIAVLTARKSGKGAMAAALGLCSQCGSRP